MKIFRATNKTSDQSGIASIMVTMIFMVIISLIVIGFAEISRREQRQSLDRQLSTAAFYAAESGVNDAVNKFNSGGATLASTDATDCDRFISDNGLTPQLSTTPDVAYTCLLIQPAPPLLNYGDIPQDSARTIPLQAVNANNASVNLNHITLYWQKSGSLPGNPTFNCASGPSLFPPTSGWNNNCGAGVLRLDLVPGGANVNNQTAVAASTFTAFLHPTNSGGVASVAFSAPSQNSGTGTPVVQANCTGGANPEACQMTISNLASIPLGAQHLYYLHVQSIYLDNELSIAGYTSATHSVPAYFTGVQLQVDATGRASDVLRRIRVRKPLTSNVTLSATALQTTNSICKRFTIVSGGVPMAAPGNTDPVCDPTNW